MKKAYLTVAAGCLLAVSTTTARAESGDISIGLKGGTLGLGVEAGVDLTEDFVLRGGINYLTFDFDSTISSIDYNFEPEFFSGSLLLDWYPFSSSFRLSAGAYLNNNTVAVEGTYRSELLPPEFASYAGQLSQAKVMGTVDFNSLAPYVGLGWTSNQHDQGWGVNMDLGIMFQGAPNVSELHIADPWGIGTDPRLNEFLDAERQAIEDELDKFQYYPVASISLSYKF